jgi:hypothetical protein
MPVVVAQVATVHKAALAKAELVEAAVAQEITLILMDIIDNMLLVIPQTEPQALAVAVADQDTTEVFLMDSAVEAVLA